MRVHSAPWYCTGCIDYIPSPGFYYTLFSITVLCKLKCILSRRGRIFCTIGCCNTLPYQSLLYNAIIFYGKEGYHGPACVERSAPPLLLSFQILQIYKKRYSLLCDTLTVARGLCHLTGLIQNIWSVDPRMTLSVAGVMCGIVICVIYLLLLLCNNSVTTTRHIFCSIIYLIYC